MVGWSTAPGVLYERGGLLLRRGPTLAPLKPVYTNLVITDFRPCFRTISAGIVYFEMSRFFPFQDPLFLTFT